MFEFPGENFGEFLPSLFHFADGNRDDYHSSPLRLKSVSIRVKSPKGMPSACLICVYLFAVVNLRPL